jgi:hypothetical protein
MTLRTSDKYYVLERLQSKYDKTDTYIAEDLVSGQVIRLRYDPYDGPIGSITIEDVTIQVNEGCSSHEPCERYEIEQEYFATANSRGTMGIEYPIIHLDTDPAGFLYVRIYYDETKKYQPNNTTRSYYGTMEFIEELFPSGEDEEEEEEEMKGI